MRRCYFGLETRVIIKIESHLSDFQGNEEKRLGEKDKLIKRASMWLNLCAYRINLHTISYNITSLVASHLTSLGSSIL